MTYDPSSATTSAAQDHAGIVDRFTGLDGLGDSGHSVDSISRGHDAQQVSWLPDRCSARAFPDSWRVPVVRWLVQLHSLVTVARTAPDLTPASLDCARSIMARQPLPVMHDGGRGCLDTSGRNPPTKVRVAAGVVVEVGGQQRGVAWPSGRSPRAAAELQRVAGRGGGRVVELVAAELGAGRPERRVDAA